MKPASAAHFLIADTGDDCLKKVIVNSRPKVLSAYLAPSSRQKNEDARNLHEITLFLPAKPMINLPSKQSTQGTAAIDQHVV